MKSLTDPSWDLNLQAQAQVQVRLGKWRWRRVFKPEGSALRHQRKLLDPWPRQPKALSPT